MTVSVTLLPKARTVSMSRGDALGVVLRCPASQWQQALDTAKQHTHDHQTTPDDGAAVQYLVHVMQVPDRSGQALCECAGHVAGVLQSGVCDKSHLQSALARADDVVTTTGDGHAQSTISRAGGLTSASLPTVRGAAVGDSSVQAACTCGSRAVYTCAAVSTTVLLLACVCGEAGVVRELQGLTGDRAVDVAMWAWCVSCWL